MEKSKQNEVIDNSNRISHREIQKAINFWSHLVPENEKTRKINKLIEKVINSYGTERLIQMEILVDLLTDENTDKAYGNYAHMVFQSSILDFTEEMNKFGGMLAGIASNRGSGGGCCPDLYWREYEMGYFDSFQSYEEEDFKDNDEF